MSLSITSEEINFLVYRYLQESGFTHSAFAFFNESTIPRSNINGANVPPGALISLIQRGLQYKEMETHLNEDGSEVQCTAPFSLVVPHVCKLENDDEDVDEAMEEEVSLITKEEVLSLRGHSKEVFISAWNPKKNLLASGSGDATARIWRIPNETGPSAKIESPIVLKHFSNSNSNNQAEGCDVTTLDWNPAGTLLATGSYDGLARIWTETGTLKLTLSKHSGPIFNLKWNHSGEYLLSGSMDKTAIVWDGTTGEVKQQFEFHKGPTLDVDWRDNSIFASCSSDSKIYVCELGRNKPIRTFQAHKQDVNSITWSPSGKLLASCSDDRSTKIWNYESGDSGPVHDFSDDHSLEVYSLKWSPTGPGSPNANKKLVLATASFDCTIKLWDVEVGKCLNSLIKHTEGVYSVSFSPDGDYIASGSMDKCIHIWSVNSGALVKTYRENAGIFDVSWNNKGDRLAASLDNNNVTIVDFRM